MKTHVSLRHSLKFSRFVHSIWSDKGVTADPFRVQVLYNKDCISDQAIIYWHQKGAKPQGKQHFLKATEALVKFLEEQEEESDEE